MKWSNTATNASNLKNNDQPTQRVEPSVITMALHTMGVCLVRPLLTGKGGCQFVMVAIDYFMKWEKAKALAPIITRNIRNFLWKAVVC
jgi:hypothetical protein